MKLAVGVMRGLHSPPVVIDDGRSLIDDGGMRRGGGGLLPQAGSRGLRGAAHGGAAGRQQPEAFGVAFSVPDKRLNRFFESVRAVGGFGESVA